MIASDQAPEGADWLSRRVTALEGLVRELLAGRRLERATIGSGGLTIKGGGDLTIRDGGGVKVLDNGDLSVQGGIVQFLDGDGNQRVYIGPLNYSGFTPGIGWVFRRHNGQIVLSLEGADPTNQFLAIRDEAGNIIVSDDAVTGQGLATPYIPLMVFPTRLLLTLSGEPTTSGTFVPLWTVQGHKQHPRLRVGVYVFFSDGTTAAEVRLRDANTAAILAGPTAVPAGPGAFIELTGSIAGAHQTGIKAEVDARRTAGTGTVYTVVAYAEGIQT